MQCAGRTDLNITASIKSNTPQQADGVFDPRGIRHTIEQVQLSCTNEQVRLSSTIEQVLLS